MNNNLSNINEINIEKLQCFKRDLLKSLAKEDFAAFCEYCFIDTENPLLPFIELQDFQKEWCELVMQHSRLNLFCPVESGKSTLLTIAYPIWRLGREPNTRIIIISATYDQAVKFLGSIKEHIVGNKYVKEIFPFLRPVMDNVYKNRPGKWSEDAIKIARTAVSKDYSVQALGVEGPLLNARTDLMIMDDVVTLKNSANIKQRQRIIEWFDSTADKRLTQSSQCINVCTAWYANDLPHYLESKKGWVTVKYSVEPEDLKLGYRLALWPQKFPPERLQALKEHNEREYNRSLRNIAKTADAYPFAGKIDGAIGTITLDDSYKILIGFDLATRKRPGSALATIAYSNIHPKKVLLDIEYGAWTPKEKRRKLVQYFDRYHPHKILVEDNALQDDAVMDYRDLKGADGRRLPIIGVTTGTNKTSWVEVLQEEFEDNIWLIACKPSGHLTRLRDELEFFPDYETSDGLMAMLLANSVIGDKHNAKRIRVSIVRDDESISSTDKSSRYDFTDYLPYNRILQRNKRDVLMPENYLVIVRWIQKYQKFNAIDFTKMPDGILSDDYQIVLSEMISYIKALNTF